MHGYMEELSQRDVDMLRRRDMDNRFVAEMVGEALATEDRLCAFLKREDQKNRVHYCGDSKRCIIANFIREEVFIGREVVVDQGGTEGYVFLRARYATIKVAKDRPFSELVNLEAWAPDGVWIKDLRGLAEIVGYMVVPEFMSNEDAQEFYDEVKDQPNVVRHPQLPPSIMYTIPAWVQGVIGQFDNEAIDGDPEGEKLLKDHSLTSQQIIEREIVCAIR